MNIKKIKIFNNGSWVEYALDGTTIDNAASLEVGSKPGSTQTKDAIWNGGTQKDEENIIRVKDGDSVDGAIAEGFQSVAFGGKRYDKVRKNDEIDTSRKPTSAEGNQSFAAGASVHAHGDFSIAFGKDNDAYQRGGFVTGGGCRVGMTEEEFNDFYWDNDTNMPLNDGKGKTIDGKITDFENKPYEQSYSFGFTSGTINKALGRDSFATGIGAQALGRDSFASGMGSKALGSESFAAGNKTYASGFSSFATGVGPDETYIATNGEVGARGRVSFVEGKVTDATGEAAHAGGGFTNASGDYSFAFGYCTQATEYCAMSIGASTVASGKNSFAGGDATTASGENAFVFGNNAVVNGRSSAAFGSSSKIYLNSNNSFIAGVGNNIKYGSQNIILGSHNNIGNPSSTKDCSNNFVANSRNTVDNTSFNVNNTAVFGYENIAKHSGVFINGNKNKSSTIYQTVIGKYNEDNSSALLIVGSGDDRYRLKSDSTKLISLDTYNALGETDKANYEENRKNALEVVGNGIKINSLKAIGDTDTSIYFHNDLNGNRKSSIWANDINILSDTKNTSSSYVSVSNKINQIDNKIINLYKIKADKTYVDDLVKDEIAKVIDSAPEAFDTLKEVANWIENDETGAAAMANEISKHNDILNGFGEEDEPSNIKDYVDGVVENINTNLETNLNLDALDSDFFNSIY